MWLVFIFIDFPLFNFLQSHFINTESMQTIYISESGISLGPINTTANTAECKHVS